jgi:hypothetical protein
MGLHSKECDPILLWENTGQHGAPWLKSGILSQGTFFLQKFCFYVE